MNKIIQSLLLTFFLSIFSILEATEIKTPKVVVTLPPIHSLVAFVMDGVAEPELLLDGTVSPHDFSLSPQDMQKLERSDFIFWIGQEIEGFLDKPIKSLGKNHKALITAKELKVIPVAHSHSHGHGHIHHELSLDGHIWLDPENASILIREIAYQLSAYDIKNAAKYQKNAQKAFDKLAKLREKMKKQLATIQKEPFIVLHDAYRYFESYFSLRNVGAFYWDPSIPLDPQEIRKITQLIENHSVKCIFSEPQLKSPILDTIATDFNLKIGTLDPLGVGISPGKDHYFKMMKQLGDSLVNCLSKQ